MRADRVHLLIAALTLILFNSASFAEAPKSDPARAFFEKQAAAFAEAFNRGDIGAVAAM